MSKNNPTKQIEQAANDAVHTIALAADAASKVISEAAANALKIATAKNSDGLNDHDTLTAFRAETVSELKNIRIDIQKLGDGTTTQLTDHETRIKLVETGQTKLMAYGTVLVFLVGVAEVLLGKYFH